MLSGINPGYPTPAPAQAQSPTAQDGGTAGNTPTAVAQATATKSQPISASDQFENSVPFQASIEGMISTKLGVSDLKYAESWLSDADEWFARLRDEIPWTAETVKMYGKSLVLRRETCNYGENYDYNVNAKPAIGWGGPVLELKKILEKFTGRVFTQCACNLYPDGETGIGLHHDKRHPLLVASLSFGAVRTIGFAPKGGKLDKSLPMIALAAGSLLLFTDAVNENFKHTIVEDKAVLGPRISVTFREFDAATEPKAAKPSQALESNASESQSLMPDGSVTGEYVEPAKSVERKVVPISRAVLSNPDTTMEHLHEMAKHELDVLDALNNEGRQTIKERLMVIWEEMSFRFERGESVNGISGTGGKGMGKYLRSIGVDPAKRRSWKFEIRHEEALRLAQENPPLKRKPNTQKEIIINSESEADLIAKAGVLMAKLLAGEGMTPPQDRINKAEAIAKDILESIAGGQYERIEPPPPLPTNAPQSHGEKNPVTVTGLDGAKIRVEEEEEDTSPEGRTPVECVFILTREERINFLEALRNLDPLRATQLMYLAVVNA
jgi:alkylated DNA repair dioxygenase AlkB